MVERSIGIGRVELLKVYNLELDLVLIIIFQMWEFGLFINYLF